MLQILAREHERLAAELFQRAAGLYGESGLWRQAAQCWLDAGYPDRAADMLSDHEDYARAAPLLLAEGRLDEALECYRRWLVSIAKTDLPGQVAARLGIAACLTLLDTEMQSARETFREARALIMADREAPALTSGQCWEALGAYGMVVGREDLVYNGYERALLSYGDEHPQERLRAGQIYLDSLQTEERPARRKTVVAPPEAANLVDPVTGLEFLRIPAGSFMMGSPDTEDGRYDDESPVHEVTISEFRLAATPVTNRQFRLWKPDHDSGAYEGHTLNEDDQPVVEVSWEDAQVFIEWLNTQPGSGGGFRLPSEAEWEYACRAGTSTARFWGDDPSEAGRYANVADKTAQREWTSWTVHDCETGYLVASPVGTFQPNAFGLYDMLGNVLEWCLGIYAEDAYDQHKRIDPIYATGENRVLRGGSWDTYPRDVRCAYRVHYAPSSRYHYIGFRLARTLF